MFMKGSYSLRLTDKERQICDTAIGKFKPRHLSKIKGGC